MKIENLLEQMVTRDSHRFELSDINTFKQSDSEVDGSFAITDRNNGVIYTSDILFNPTSGQYKIVQIDVKDSQMTHDGDAEDLKLVQAFVDQHKDELFAKFTTDGEHERWDNWEDE